MALYRYIAEAASPGIAARYTEAIVSYCEACARFPIGAPSAMTCGLVCASPTTGSVQ